MNTHEDFHKVTCEERENLTRLSEYWNTQIKCNLSLSKDDQGRIRAAVGKTRLLLAEKFKQFEGLIEQSENNTSEKEISINDLQGFWDLVLIQVNEIKEMYRSIGAANEKANAEVRKFVKSKSPETEPKTTTKAKYSSKKKFSSDNIDQTGKKTKDHSDKNNRVLEKGDLKNKTSFSKL